jgi:hypothetical protein
VGKGWAEGGRDGRERGTEMVGRRAREGRVRGPRPKGRWGRGLQSCLRRAKVWSIITSHACLCTAQNLVYVSAL